MTDCWSIHLERLTTWRETYCMVDLAEFEMQSEEFRTYLVGSWSHVLRRRDLHLCFITGDPMKALIWHSILVLMGSRKRVKIFSTDKRAFEWLSRRLQPDGTESLPTLA
jgi:hypothetical protein